MSVYTQHNRTGILSRWYTDAYLMVDLDNKKALGKSRREKRELERESRKSETRELKNGPAEAKEPQKLINTWTDDQIQSRVKEVERDLSCGTLSKSRRRLLYSKIVKLRKALKGEAVVGGQKEAKAVNKNRRKIDKRWSDTSALDTRWKECLCCESI